MDITEALEYIHTRVSWMGTKPGLAREAELLRLLGNPEKKLKFVHIAGTNGKGSTAAMLASILHEAGYVTGLYTSPYIYRFNERIQVGGEQIPDEDVVRLVEKIRPLADSMEDHPTEFEVVTAMGFEYFAERGCDIVVCEVGMGGEFDATNVIEVPEVAVIVNIGLDHTQVLGDTVEEIAMAKAGILKEGGDCVLYAQKSSVESVIAEVCRARHIRLRIAGTEKLTPVSRSIEGQVFDYGVMKHMRFPLLGEHQLRNACTVLTTVEVLRARGWRITEQCARIGLEKVSWPGRFEVVGHEPLFIIDGGHNPQCLAAFEQALDDYLPGVRPVFLTGCMADKDYGEMYAGLARFASAFVTVTPRNPRAMSAEDLKGQLEKLGKPVTACASVEEGVRTAVERTGRSGTVCACGSLYMIGDIYDALKEIRTEGKMR